MERRSLEQWRWENDEALLRRAMIADVSYPEYVIIVHRLRELTNKGDADVRWEAHERGETVETDLIEHPSQLRALFVHGSPFRDNIAYAEYKPLWLAKVDTRDRLPSGCPAGLDDRVWRLFRGRVTSEMGRADVERTWAACCMEVANDRPGDAFTTVLADEQLRIVEGAWSSEVRMTDWRKTGEARFALFGEVDQGDKESELIERLIGAGAQITENRLQIDDYHQAGKRFTLSLPDDVLMHYVPHASIGTRELERFVHRLRWVGGEQAVAAVRERIVESFEAHRVTADDVLVTIDHYDRIGLEPRVRLTQKNRLGPKRREAMEAAADGEQLVRLGEGTKWARHTTVLHADDSRLRRFPGYYTEIEPGSFMYHHAARARERLLGMAEQLKDLSVEVKFEAEFDDPPQLGVGGAAEAVAHVFRERLSQAMISLELDPDVAKDLRNMLSIAGVEALFDHRVESVTRREEIVHDAPLSERGMLRIENARPDRALELLMGLGIIGGVCEEVPYEPIYRGRHRRGRVLPWHPDYALGAAELSLPDGYVIMHGLTAIGYGRGDQVVKHLEQIITTGGLKSIAERRRMNLHVTGTMSPVGDTGSGIDVGVPTRISPHGSPGSAVYFVMKPTCILRRDLFFSNVDFGGSEGRFESYNAYAESIGQGKMHHVASHHARKQHLRTGLGSSNELYLRHEIPWDEVDCLIVDDRCVDRITELVERYQALGELPSELRVIQLNPVSIAASIHQWIDERPTTDLACV